MMKIEAKRPNKKGLWYLKTDEGEIISRSFRKTKLKALRYLIYEGIYNIVDIKQHRYLESTVMEIEKEMIKNEELYYL